MEDGRRDCANAEQGMTPSGFLHFSNHRIQYGRNYVCTRTSALLRSVRSSTWRASNRQGFAMLPTGDGAKCSELPIHFYPNIKTRKQTHRGFLMLIASIVATVVLVWVILNRSIQDRLRQHEISDLLLEDWFLPAGNYSGFELTERFNPTVRRVVEEDAVHGDICWYCVPKIIHHTYRTLELPPEYAAVRKECMEMHPDYQFMLWTDDSARAMIAERYGPDHVWNYDSYNTHNIQRADALRYYVLHAFGGFYADLNTACPRRWDPLRHYPMVVGRAVGMGVTNDFLAAAPGHPFMLDLVSNLAKFNRHYVLPSFTVLLSTGPLYVSARWYVQPADVLRQIRVLPTRFFGGDNPRSFIQNRDVLTGSWHGWDMKLASWLAKQVSLPWGIVLCVALLAKLWSKYRKLMR